jgi:hypothetical protein
MADLKVVIGVDDTAVLRGVDRVNKLERGYKRLDTAFNKGKITIQQYAQGVQQIDAAIKNMDTSIKRATASQERFENTSRKGMRRMEILAQQAGYQIGDLAVQIQSGTNAAVAFGQQGSQLLGFFGPAGAIAGAGLAIATGLIAPFLNARDSADDLTLSIDNVATALNKLTSRKQVLTDLLTTPFLEGQETLQGYLDRLLEAENKKIRTALSLAVSDQGGGEGLLAGLQKELEGVEEKIRVSTKSGFDFGQVFEDNVSKAKLLKKQIEQISFAVRGEAAEKRTVLENAEELLRIGKLYGGDIQKQIDAILKQTGLEEELVKLGQYRVSAQAAINKQTSDINSELRDKANADRKAGKAESDRLDNLRKQLDTLKDQTTFQENLVGLEGEALIRQRGKNAQYLLQLKYVKEGLAADDQSLRNAVKHLGYLTDAQVKEYRRQETLKEQAKEAKRLAKAIEATARAAANFDSFMGKAGSKIPELRARLAVLRGGGTETEAGIAGVRAKALAEFQAQVQTIGGAPPDVLAKQQGEYVAKKVEEAELEAQITAELNARREAEKGVGKTALQTLKERLTLEQALIGKTEAQRQIIQALGVDYKKTYDEDIITGLENTINKTIELQNEQQKLLDIADSIESNFGDALMGIVTDFDILNSSIEDFGYHAEQVFKKMASEIIKELYRIFVVKKITGFVEGAITGTYADLGRVGAPSMDGGGYTGSGPRSGGLDGKGGFLAMLHPRETVIDHTKGQSGGVTVQQNFNFSANGDESVKRMIAQAAPQIAKMTEKGIMDSRRRGGQMKAVFG